MHGCSSGKSFITDLLFTVCMTTLQLPDDHKDDRKGCQELASIFHPHINLTLHVVAYVSVAHLRESENGPDFENLLTILYFGFLEYVKRIVRTFLSHAKCLLMGASWCFQCRRHTKPSANVGSL